MIVRENDGRRESQRGMKVSKKEAVIYIELFKKFKSWILFSYFIYFCSQIPWEEQIEEPFFLFSEVIHWKNVIVMHPKFEAVYHN